MLSTVPCSLVLCEVSVTCSLSVLFGGGLLTWGQCSALATALLLLLPLLLSASGSQVGGPESSEYLGLDQGSWRATSLLVCF